MLNKHISSSERCLVNEKETEEGREGEGGKERERREEEKGD